MTKFPLRDPIVSNPKILGGEPIIKGTRIPASLLYELAINRKYTPDILTTEYPSLTKENVLKFLLLVNKDTNAQASREI